MDFIHISCTKINKHIQRCEFSRRLCYVHLYNLEFCNLPTSFNFSERILCLFDYCIFCLKIRFSRMLRMETKKGFISTKVLQDTNLLHGKDLSIGKI